MKSCYSSTTVTLPKHFPGFSRKQTNELNTIIEKWQDIGLSLSLSSLPQSNESSRTFQKKYNLMHSNYYNVYSSCDKKIKINR
jgi:hypothetical protein